MARWEGAASDWPLFPEETASAREGKEKNREGAAASAASTDQDPSSFHLSTFPPSTPQRSGRNDVTLAASSSAIGRNQITQSTLTHLILASGNICAFADQHLIHDSHEHLIYQRTLS